MPNKTIGQLPLLPGPAGTNEFAIWNGSNTFRVSLDTIKQYAISGITDNNTYVTGGTYDSSTATITLFRNDGVSIPITGISTEDIYVSGGTYDSSTDTITLFRNDGVTIPITGISTDDIYLTGGTYDNSLVTLTDNKGNLIQFNVDVTTNKWHVPSGTTLTVKNGFQSFIYGDLYVEGVLSLEDEAQLVVLNGDIILSGGTISGGGTTLLVELPIFDTKVVSGSYNQSTGVATFTNNSGGTFTVTGFYTGSTEIYTTGGTYNQSSGVATFTNNTGGTYNVSGFLTGYTNFYTTGATLIGAIAYFDRTDALSAYTLDLSSIDFTGNTSGSCIGDLWLSNLHGCSPITFHDSLQHNSSSASGLLSTAFGNISSASGDYSNAEGSQTTASNFASHAEGFLTIANGDSSHAEGFQTTSSGDWSHSEGASSTSAGLSSHAEGFGTSSIGNFSHSQGYYTIANGIGSHAEGFFTSSNGYASHAGGISSTASGLNSFIHSSGSTVTGIRSVVLGGKGLSGPDNDTVYVPNFDSRGISRFSGSSTNVVTIIGSGSTAPIFKVQGSSGELFSVTDSLTGSLFSVNDISGLPVLEAYSDNTILMGSYQAPSLNTTVKKTLSAGANNIYSIPTSAYTGAFFDYTLIRSTGARAGNVMSIWSGSSVQYTDTSTNDIGSTTGVTFSVVISGSSAVLQGTASTSGWTLKTIVRSI